MAGTKGKRTVVVGETWPDGIEIVRTTFSSRWQDPRAVVMTWIAIIVGLLLLSTAGYGIYTHDTELLNKIFSLSERSVYLIIGWVVGHTVTRQPLRE